MSKITYPDKVTGGQFTAANANEIKSVVNTNDDTLVTLSPANFGSFSTTINFTKAYQYLATSHTITGATQFTVSLTDAIVGAVTKISVTANGINEPTFTGGINKTNTYVYNNTNAVVNHLVFFYDGTAVWVNCWQLSGQGTTIIPTLSTPANFVANPASSSAITMTWSDVANESSYLIQRSLNGTTGWSTIATIASNAVTYTDTNLTPSTHYYYRLAAEGDGVNYLTSAWTTADATTNSSGISLQDFVISTSSNITKTGTTYSQTTPVSAYSGFALGTKKLATSADGYVQMSLATTSDYNAILGLSTSNSNTNYTGYKYFVWANDQSNYYVGADGGNIEDTGVAPQIGDLFRLRRTSGTVYAEYYRNGSWTVIKTFGTTYTSNLYWLINTYSNFVADTPKGYNVS